jgi:hypothetical protein
MRRVAVLIACLAAACGGGDDPPTGDPDAPPSPPDGAVYPACEELATGAMPLPIHMTADVVDAGADMIAPQSCAVVEAPFGVESAGVDRVIRLGGLVPGTDYGVSLRAGADLGFYVITGCTTAAGPDATECALFVDASTDGDEVGRFTATAATAWVVIDTYSSTPPEDGGFTVDVYAVTCDDDGACGGDTPACLDGRCVGCLDAFDCPAAVAPRCDDALHACMAGDTACPGDDGAEPGDDGPSGGRALVPDGGGHAALGGAICDAPENEVDFYTFTVGAAGESWQLGLTWAGAADLDLYVFDATGRRLGMSFWEQPETVVLTYLAPGTYHVMVDRFDDGGDPTVEYTLSAVRAGGPGCYDAGDCAAEYRNQLFRGDCVAGACVPIDGDGEVGELGACDSTSDCAPDLACPSFFFVADADRRGVCARGCTYDTDCEALGEDYVCTTYLAENFCVQKCTTDDHCPTSVSASPAYPPWYRLDCQPSSGRCLPP